MQVLLELARDTINLPDALSADENLAGNLVVRNSALEEPSAIDELVQRDGGMGLRLMDDRSLVGHLMNRNLGVGVLLIDD